MHGLPVYVKEELPFAGELSLENSADTYFIQCLTSFSYLSSFSPLCTLFDSILSNIDEVVSINSSINLFVFGDFNIHHKNSMVFSYFFFVSTKSYESKVKFSQASNHCKDL